MVEIKPGLELDQAIAEAVDPYCSVGMCASSGCIDIPVSKCNTAATDVDVLAVWKWNGERNWRTLPKSSTDLNAAFAAAEKAGLFQECEHILGKTPEHCCNGGSWFMNHTRDRDDELDRDSEVGSGPTPALAICAAILKLKQ